MPEENQRITREHLPGLLLARAIWERGPSLYFPPALKTATDQARACSLEMKTHCVELYRDAPELHEVVLASEALAACAARDARIVGLEAKYLELEAVLYAERIAADDQRRELDAAAQNLAGLRAELAAIKAQGVVMPERMSLGAATRLGQRFEVRESFCAGANYMHGEFARLNAAPVQQVSVPDGWRLIKSDPPAVGQCVVLAGPQGSDAPGRYWRLTGIRRDDGYYDANGCGCDDATHWHTLLDSPGTLAAAPAAPAADAGLVEAPACSCTGLCEQRGLASDEVGAECRAVNGLLSTLSADHEPE